MATWHLGRIHFSFFANSLILCVLESDGFLVKSPLQPRGSDLHEDEFIDVRALAETMNFLRSSAKISDADKSNSLI